MVNQRFISVSERFWSKVDQSGECWLWTAVQDGNGYGQFKLEHRMVGAHRWAYEQSYGSIPAGLEIDHLCRTRVCVRPDHLETVTTRTNLLRGNGLTAQNARKTHCPQGHPYDLPNTRWERGRRHCRECGNKHVRDYKRRCQNDMAASSGGSLGG